LQVWAEVLVFAPMKARKTIEIEKIKERANHYLANSWNIHDKERKGCAGLVTTLLMDAGAYRGFAYLRKEDVGPLLTFGVEWVDGKPVHHDESRIYFF